MRRDLVCAAAGLALAGAYYAAADAIPTSLLTDDVGAGGIPKLLAVALALLSRCAAGRAQPARGLAARRRVDGARTCAPLGIAGLGFVYVARRAATRLSASRSRCSSPRRRSTTASGCGRPSSPMRSAARALLWLVFAKLLGVAMPAGAWARLLG